MGTGRKKIKINWEKVDKWLEAGAKGTEVAAALGISFDTLSRRCLEDHSASFADYSQIKRECGNAKLRLKQQELAMEGDRGMLIWLGKNRLDQTDKQENKNNVSMTQPVQFVFESKEMPKLPESEEEVLKNNPDEAS
ncbi:MAG: hypothetical protein GY827_08430 [Cytophagales bacterium]|nr:hypothetical protein [Cytophagales bacterium]